MCNTHFAAMTDRDSQTIVVSIDGVGAHDLISERNPGMFVEDGRRRSDLPIRPVISSTYLWEDEM